MSDRLDKAISDFEDETLDLTLGERISGLRQALTWNAFEAMKRINARGKKDPQSEEEDFKQTEYQIQFKVIERMYTSHLKHNKLLGKAQDDGIDKEWLRKLKESDASMGSIVRNMNEKTA